MTNNLLELKNISKTFFSGDRRINLFNNINVTFTTIKKKFSKVLVVSSCKGGVGKSTLSVNLAFSLKNLGKKLELYKLFILGLINI